MHIATLNQYIKRLLFICLLAGSVTSYSQDSTPKITLDKSFLRAASLRLYRPEFNCIYHYPGKKDQQRFNTWKSLIKQQPTAKNYELYYELACSLWRLEKIADAEKMFLTIVNSTEEYYGSTYTHSSDIAGDKTKSVFGYGSFTSNYKNYSAIYLTKIYLEQKRYKEALQFLDGATKKYKVAYTCGTGLYRQQDEYDFLYASCYEGLNRHKEVIDLLLPSCLDRNDKIIIAAIKNSYSQKEIKEYLQKAENSITYSLDILPSYAYKITYNDNKKEKTDTIEYHFGTATIMLFNRQITMPVPSLENGKLLTREQFVTLFKESDFYTRLSEEVDL